MVKTGFVMAVVTAMASSISFGADFSCPKDVQTEQTLSAPTAGWRVFQDKVNDRQWLTQISLYDGPPEEMADLEPDNGEAKGRDGWQWTFDPTSGHRIWEVCKYSNTSVRLTRELPASVKKCQVIPVKGSVSEIDTLRCD